MSTWHVDEGLAALIGEWKKAHPGAVVYTIGDAAHAARDSEHNPEKAGPQPGQDAGEVDAADFMPGHGVTDNDLGDLFHGLVRSRDPRILYLIHGQVIVSSLVRPWSARRYDGAFHGHLHVSVNDRYDDNTSDWHWEKLMARTITYVPIATQLPQLQLGDEDAAQGGWNHIARAQVLANWLDSSLPDLETDGVYGAKTAQKLSKILGGDGRKLPLAGLKKLHGLS